ncbi:unnamed protein product [Blepharisma stoltei]|uniref:EGF-like domain-containing protein n=1 Tax=Blepharisma stoltei TaxID=1481888 RepID=A0AAU9JB88_9CILI|nr:unnamed protein product [Blepharisma stoltei]
MTFYNNWCYCTNPEGSVFNSTSKNCNCPNGTWNDGRYCQACNETCSSCTNQDTCTSCIDTTNMNLIQGTCSCKDPSSSLNPASGLCEYQAGYYMENSICYACQPPCKTCINSTFCSSCLGSNMTLADGICSCPANSTFSLADGVCHCIIGYFLDQSQVCQSCFLGCATCNDSSCLSCMDPGAMTIQNGVCSCRFPGAHFNSTTNKCDCPVGMFRNGSECFSCSDGCLSCTSETECLSCFEPREFDYPYTLISGSCECLYNNSFSDGSNGCSCSEGYYLTQDKLQCLDCPDGCLTCSSFNGFCGQNQSVCCLSCVDPRMFISSNGLCQCGLSNSYFSSQLKSCQCNGGYYLSNDTCSLCSLPCGNCTTDPLNCTSCALPGQMTLLNNTCSCTSPSSSIYDLKLNECICPTGKYLNNTNCDVCPATCMSCESSANCLSCVDPIHMTIGNNGICTCPKNSTFDGKACVCNNNYFWRGLECTYCKSPCNKCVSQTICLSCMDPNNFALKNGECRCRDPNAHFNNVEDLCVCNDGYFMVNSACRACQVTCSTCENSIACTGCIDKDYMNLINGICACNDTNASFISSQKKCVCNQGYQLVNSVCIECPVEYSACSASNVCTQCVNPEEMTVISVACICNINNTIYDSFSNSCSCKEKYYYDGNECVACQSPLCARCENNRCSSCNYPVNMDLSCGICSCSDPNSYFNTSSGLCECLHDFEPNLIENTLKCVPIWSPCREFSVDGLCLKCADNSMQLYQGQCYCLDPNASYNKTTQNCTCNFGYQLTAYSKLCQPCDSQLYGGINGCVNCNSGICLECQKGMRLDWNRCNCLSGQIWNDFIGTCVCLRGYWNSTQCPSCGCYSCSTNGACLEPCSQNSTWIYGKCTCNNGFYECSPNQCCTMSRTCSDRSRGYCGACVSSMELINDNKGILCLCPFNSAYNSQLNKCVPACSIFCNNCSSNSTCLSCQAPFLAQNENCMCDPNAVQSWNTCICKDGYYMNSTYSCLPCPENCATCISATICTSCRGDFVLVNKNCLCSDFNAVYNSQISQCECSTGYYSKGSKCKACLTTCYDCLDDGTTCTSCVDKIIWF